MLPRHYVLAVLTWCIPFLALARPVIIEDVAKLTPPGPNDQLVTEVAVSGNHLVFVTRRNFVEPGEVLSEQFAYLYTRGPADSWTYTATLSSIRHPHQASVRMVASVYGDLAAVHLSEPHDARLFVFERSGTQWLQTASIAGTAGGYDLEFDGGRVIVGAHDCSWGVFGKGSSGWRALASAGRSGLCAGDVDMSGDIIAVAGRFPPGNVLLYHGIDSGNQPAIIPDPLSDQDGQFGYRIALGGSTLFSTRQRNAIPQIFSYVRETDGEWRRTDSFEEPDAAQLGWISSMDAQEGRLATGYPSDSSRVTIGGSVTIYERDASGAYSAGARLFPRDAVETDHVNRPQFGTRVDIDGRTVAASARHSVYVFRLPSRLGDHDLIQDDFQDGDQHGWETSIGSWNVTMADGSRVYQQRHPTGFNLRAIYTDVVGANQSIEAQARPLEFSGHDRWFGLISRYSDASNYYYLSVRNSNRVILRKRQDGIFSNLDDASLEVAPNKTYRLRLEAIGARIRGYVNGELVVESVDRGIRNGNAGLITSGTRANFDNVVITPSPLLPLFLDNFEGQFVHDLWRTVSGEWEHIHEYTGPNGEQRAHYAQTALSGIAQAIGGVDTGDQVIEVEVSAPSSIRPNAWYGTIARYRNARNFYYLAISGDGRISLRKQVNGSNTVLDSAPLVHQPGVHYVLRLEALGSSLRGYVNDRLVLEARDSSHRVGAYGLGTFGAAADFHDVSVTQP